MQPIFDNIKNYVDNFKSLCRCRQVQMDPNFYWLYPGLNLNLIGCKHHANVYYTGAT